MTRSESPDGPRSEDSRVPSRYFARFRRLWRPDSPVSSAPSNNLDAAAESTAPIAPSAEHLDYEPPSKGPQAIDIVITNGAEPPTQPLESPKQISSFPDRRLEKNKALFAKYGLDLPESDWPTQRRCPVERVERPIRVRVRFLCHKCQAQLGRDKECPKCNHRRCAKCLRNPPKKDALRVRRALAAASSAATNPEAVSVAVTSVPSDLEFTRGTHRTEMPLPQFLDGDLSDTIPEPDQNDRIVKKAARLRVRHTCHECRRVFTDGEQRCGGCNHERCTQCPRSPPRKERRPPIPESHSSASEDRMSTSGSEAGDPGGHTMVKGGNLSSAGVADTNFS